MAKVIADIFHLGVIQIKGLNRNSEFFFELIELKNPSKLKKIYF